MTETVDIPPESERRIRLTHHVLNLDDGHRVGVSVGGVGVPLVFMHGLALSRRAYLRMLSRFAGLGFRVVALDAAGHGDTGNLPRSAGELADRVDLALRALDVLGIEKAVFAGHSMGGRMAIRLAAIAPERALALVLFDAAAGASFDTAVATALKSPRRALQTAVDMAMDTRSDPPLKGERVSYLRTLASVALRNKPAGVSGAARAIVGSGPYTPLLHVIRDRGVPMMILHGEHDRIVPFDAAVDMADDADGTLYRVPGAYHSWMLANPRHGSDALRQLLDGDLGLALRHEADQLGIGDWRDAAAWDRVLVRPDASVRGLGGDEVIERDPDPPRRVELELVRCADGPRSVKRMPWMRRTYRRWSARYSGLARTSAS